MTPAPDPICTLRRNLRHLIAALKDAGVEGINQSTLSMAAGYKNPSGLNNFLKKKKNPSIGLDKLARMVPVLRVTMSELFDPAFVVGSVLPRHGNMEYSSRQGSPHPIEEGSHAGPRSSSASRLDEPTRHEVRAKLRAISLALSAIYESLDAGSEDEGTASTDTGPRRVHPRPRR